MGSEIVLVTIIFFAGLLILMMTGLPIAFVLSALGMLMALCMWGTGAPYMIYLSTISLLNYYTIVALPLFVFMGVVLSKSGVGEDLFEVIHKWMGPINGGLSMGAIVISVIMAAMVGVSGPAIIVLALIALPAMLGRGYDKIMVTGAIQAGGGLGILIPPSSYMILYAIMAGLSLGKLFAAAIFPGLLLAVIFIIYIGIRCLINPKLGPALPINERASWKDKFIALKSLVMPLLLIFLALGIIFLGIAAPTEAAAIAAVGSLICAAVNKKLTWKLIHESCIECMHVSALLGWLLIGVFAYTNVYNGLGAIELIQDIFLKLDVGKWGALLLMQLTWFLLGIFMDEVAMLFITMPVYLPIIKHFGFDPIWFGILYCINAQMALMTPPFGFNIFIMKGIAPKEISLGDIYRSVWPFVALQGLCLVIVMLYPEIALWLPSKIFK